MSQRRDVSAKLGSLLLKGYKMLADSCPKCNNVLMQDKKGVIICVNCNDSGLEPPSNNNPISADLGHLLPEHGYSARAPYRAFDPKEGPPEAACYAEGVLLREIKNMALHLERNQVHLDLEGNSDEIMKNRTIQLQYIRQCAETIQSLQGIRM